MPNLTRDVLTKPATPTLGAAPFWFTDPTFGHRIVRVTDGNATASIEPAYLDGSYHPPSGSQQRMWNSDSTHFYITRTDGAVWLYAWNASTMTATLRERLQYDSEPTFSRTDPRYIYGRSWSYANHQTITRGDISTTPVTYTVTLNVETLIPALVGQGTYLANIFSADNGSIQFATGGGSNDYTHYIVVYPLANPAGAKILDTRTRAAMFKTYGVGPYTHSSIVDLSGRYVTMTVSGFQSRSDICWVWDAVSDTVTEMTTAPGGHAAYGDGWQVNNDVLSGPWDAAQWVYRDLATPNSGQRQLISPVLTPQEIFLADHGNANSNKMGDGVKRPYFSAVYRYYDGPYNIDNPPTTQKNMTPWRAWDDEIIAIPTDNGGGPVQRFCHHRALVWPEPVAERLFPFNFWAVPIANASPNGRWIAFQSNWDHTLGMGTHDQDNSGAFGTYHRQDVFIVDLGESGATLDPRVRGRRPGGGRIYAR